MCNSKIVSNLKEELQKVKKQKLSLRRTTREEYSVLTMLINYYEDQIKRYKIQ